MKLESVYLFISYSSNNADSKLLLHKQDFFETKKIKTNKKEKKKKKKKCSRVEREKATLELRLLHRPDYSRRRLVAVRIYKKRQQI